MTLSGGAGPDARSDTQPRHAQPDSSSSFHAQPGSRLGSGASPSSPPSPSRPVNALTGRGWPFIPLAPLVVVFVGLAVALGIGLVGLDHLARAGDQHAGARAELLAATVAARLSQLPESRRLEASQLAARRSDAELLVVA